MKRASPFTEFGEKMNELGRLQDVEDFKREFGYPVGVDFMTMKPLYWAPSHKVAKIKTISGTSYTDLNSQELFVGHRVWEFATGGYF